MSKIAVRLQSLCLAAAIAAFVLGIASVLTAAEPLMIETKSGRYFSGSLHPRTDRQQLWIRTGEGQTALLRPIRWELVATAWLHDRRLSREELQGMTLQLLGEVPEKTTAPVFAPPTLTTPPAPESYPPIRGVSFNAALDGSFGYGIQNSLTLNVRPYDGFFETVPVDGTLEVTLIAPQLRDFCYAPDWRGYALQKVGYWAVPIQASQFGVDGTTVQLPIPARYSELNPSVSPYGLVDLRLVVPGSGVYEKALDGLRLRPLSPIRDLYQLQQGRRVFPFERMGP